VWLALVWVLLATLAGGWALTYSFRTTVQAAFDAQLTSLLNVLIGLSEADANGRLQLTRGIGDPQFEKVYSGWYWLIDSDGSPPLRSRSLWDLELDVAPPPVSATPTISSATDSEGRPLRVAAQTVRLPGLSAPVTYVVTGDLDALQSQYRQFDWTLRAALSALGLGLIVAMLVQVYFGLRPLDRLAREVEAVRTGRADALPSSGTRELDPLVDEVNSLIQHNRRIVERARASASDMAHALKTPLAVIQSIENADPAAAREQREQVAAMERIVTRHLARAAAAGPGRHAAIPIAPIVEALTRGLSRVHADRELAVESRISESLGYGADREDLEEMLGNLIENAYKWAQHRIRIDASQAETALRVTIEDDGPGIEGDPARAIARGVRLDEKTPGTGLGLSIVTDIASIYGGTLDLTSSDLGGLKAVLELPLTRV
jgi:signal transduction histidine kinase